MAMKTLTAAVVRDLLDAHLSDLARRHGLHLATLDTGIPGAFVIPERSP